MLDAQIGGGQTADGLVYQKIGEETSAQITIIGYTGTAPRLTIPDSIEGIPVTRIVEQAFENSENLVEVALPVRMTKIGSSAFISCDSLKEVILPASVFSIESNAFSGSSNVVLIVEPDSYAEQYAVQNEIPYRYSSSETCEHEWGAGKITTDPACETEGVRTYACSKCGETRTETIPAAGHTWDAGKVTKEASCGTDGVRTYTCTSCQKTKTETILALEHRWSSWETQEEATVFQPELQARQCSLCGKKETRENGQKLKPTMTLSAVSIPLKVKQKTSAVEVTNMAEGDAVASWISSNPKIAKVSGKSDGTCTITAMNRAGSTTVTVVLKSGLSRKFTVKVQKGIVKTKSLSGVEKRLTLKKGQNLTLKPVRRPLTSQEKITYSSSNKKVASVSSKGVIKAIKPGTAKITVKSGSKKQTCTVKVQSPSVSKIKNVKTRVTLKKGKTLTLRPTLLPSGANAKITYSSSNKKIAAVTAKGKITAKKKGTAVVTVKAGKVRAKCKVTVK